MKACAQSLCGRAAKSGGLCGAHYQRQQRGDDMERPLRHYGVGESGRPCWASGCTRPVLVKVRSGKQFSKCALTKQTKGPATDVRQKWPACEKWEAA